jgi:hypothetical protein
MPFDQAGGEGGRLITTEAARRSLLEGVEAGKASHKRSR